MDNQPDLQENTSPTQNSNDKPNENKDLQENTLDIQNCDDTILENKDVIETISSNQNSGDTQLELKDVQENISPYENCDGTVLEYKDVRENISPSQNSEDKLSPISAEYYFTDKSEISDQPSFDSWVDSEFEDYSMSESQSYANISGIQQGHVYGNFSNVCRYFGNNIALYSSQQSGLPIYTNPTTPSLTLFPQPVPSFTLSPTITTHLPLPQPNSHLNLYPGLPGGVPGATSAIYSNTEAVFSLGRSPEPVYSNFIPFGQVFMKESFEEQLDTQAKLIRSEAVILIQKCVRSYVARKKVLRVLNASRKIQIAIRMWKAR